MTALTNHHEPEEASIRIASWNGPPEDAGGAQNEGKHRRQMQTPSIDNAYTAVANPIPPEMSPHKSVFLSFPCRPGPCIDVAHHQWTPTNRNRQSLKEFRRLAFESVADELEDPSDREESESVEPQAMKGKLGNENRDQEQDRRNAERMAEAVDKDAEVAGRVLRDPLLAGAVA